MCNSGMIPPREKGTVVRISNTGTEYRVQFGHEALGIPVGESRSFELVPETRAKRTPPGGTLESGEESDG